MNFLARLSDGLFVIFRFRTLGDGFARRWPGRFPVSGDWQAGAPWAASLATADATQATAGHVRREPLIAETTCLRAVGGYVI